MLQALRETRHFKAAVWTAARPCCKRRMCPQRRAPWRVQTHCAVLLLSPDVLLLAMISKVSATGTIWVWQNPFSTSPVNLDSTLLFPSLQKESKAPQHNETPHEISDQIREDCGRMQRCLVIPGSCAIMLRKAVATKGSFKEHPYNVSISQTSPNSSPSIIGIQRESNHDPQHSAGAWWLDWTTNSWTHWPSKRYMRTKTRSNGKKTITDAN